MEKMISVESSPNCKSLDKRMMNVHTRALQIVGFNTFFFSLFVTKNGRGSRSKSPAKRGERKFLSFFFFFFQLSFFVKRTDSWSICFDSAALLVTVGSN